MSYNDYIQQLFQKDLTVNPLAPLKPEQIPGVKHLLTHNRGAICYQTGLGKTYTTLTAAQHLKNLFKEALGIHIFSPHTAFKIFRKEMQTKVNLGDFNEYSSDGIKEFPSSHTFLYSHSTLSKTKMAVLENCAKHKYNIFIVDEVHLLQNPETEQYQIFKLGEKDKETKEVICPPLMPQAFAVWGMTATPLLNHIEGLFYTMDFIVPGIFGNFYQFRARFCDTLVEEIRIPDKSKPGQFKKQKITTILGIKAEKLQEFKDILFKYLIIAAKDYDINIKFRQCELDRRQLQQYRDVGKGLADLERKQFSTRLIDLQKVVDNVYTTDYHGEFTPKERTLIDTLRDIFDKNEACLVYTQFYESYDRIKEVIKLAGLGESNLLEVNGKVSFKERFDVEAAIQPKSVVLVTKAGTASMNLQKANNIICYTIPFAIGDFIQLVGRITRVDSLYTKFHVHILETIGTIDSYKRAHLERNATLIKSLFGSQPVLDMKERHLDDVDFKKLKRELLWSVKGAKQNKTLEHVLQKEEFQPVIRL